MEGVDLERSALRELLKVKLTAEQLELLLSTAENWKSPDQLHKMQAFDAYLHMGAVLCEIRTFHTHSGVLAAHFLSYVVSWHPLHSILFADNVLGRVIDALHPARGSHFCGHVLDALIELTWIKAGDFAGKRAQIVRFFKRKQNLAPIIRCAMYEALVLDDFEDELPDTVMVQYAFTVLSNLVSKHEEIKVECAHSGVLQHAFALRRNAADPYLRDACAYLLDAVGIDSDNQDYYDELTDNLKPLLSADSGLIKYLPILFWRKLEMEQAINADNLAAELFEFTTRQPGRCRKINEWEAALRLVDARVYGTDGDGIHETDDHKSEASVMDVAYLTGALLHGSERMDLDKEWVHLKECLSFACGKREYARVFQAVASQSALTHVLHSGARVVVISGHGQRDYLLGVENGISKVIALESKHCENVQLLILLMCHSSSVARKLLSEGIGPRFILAVHSDVEIGEKHAHDFVLPFLKSAVRNGESVRRAFEHTRDSLRLKGDTICCCEHSHEKLPRGEDGDEKYPEEDCCGKCPLCGQTMCCELHHSEEHSSCENAIKSGESRCCRPDLSHELAHTFELLQRSGSEDTVVRPFVPKPESTVASIVDVSQYVPHNVAVGEILAESDGICRRICEYAKADFKQMWQRVSEWLYRQMIPDSRDVSHRLRLLFGDQKFCSSVALSVARYFAKNHFSQSRYKAVCYVDDSDWESAQMPVGDFNALQNAYNEVLKRGSDKGVKLDARKAQFGSSTLFILDKLPPTVDAKQLREDLERVLAMSSGHEVVVVCDERFAEWWKGGRYSVTVDITQVCVCEAFVALTKIDLRLNENLNALKVALTKSPELIRECAELVKKGYIGAILAELHKGKSLNHATSGLQMVIVYKALGKEKKHRLWNSEDVRTAKEQLSAVLSASTEPADVNVLVDRFVAAGSVLDLGQADAKELYLLFERLRKRQREASRRKMSDASLMA